MASDTLEAGQLLDELATAAVSALQACLQGRRLGLDVERVVAQAEELLASAGLAALPAGNVLDHHDARLVLAAAWSTALVSLEALKAEVATMNALLREQVATMTTTPPSTPLTTAPLSRTRARRTMTQRAMPATPTQRRVGALEEQSELEASAARKGQLAKVAKAIGEATAKYDLEGCDGAISKLDATVEAYPWLLGEPHLSECLWRARRELMEGKFPYALHQLHRAVIFKLDDNQ